MVSIYDYSFEFSHIYLSTLLFIVIAIWFYMNSQRSAKKLSLPPGPIPLPLIGNVLQIGRKAHLSFTRWAKKYGPIFRIKIGSDSAVVITDHKLMKELFHDSASTGRMSDNPILDAFANGPNGVANSEGATWEAQRGFVIRILKDFGISKTSLEGMILDEAQAMLKWFKKSDGKPISGNRIFNAPVVNSLWRIVAGEKCEWEECHPPILENAAAFFTSIMEVSMNGIFFAPILRYIAPELLGWNRYLKDVKNMFTLLNESIQKHKDTFNPDNLRDFIDYYLWEIERTSDSNSSFFENNGYTNMVSVIFDLFLAGSETSANTLSWILLYLSQHQKNQKKLQMEIDEVVGSQTPSLSLRPRMPYTEAVIMEILRISSVVCIGVPHRVNKDTHFHGYFLPKGTSIFGNIYGIHYDPEVWGDPETFRPERFLSDDGTKVVRHEALVPFSEGKRKCIGETLAKNTLFLFLVSICQNYDIISVKNESGDMPDFEPDIGLLLVPKPFQVVMSPRKDVNKV